MKINLKYNILLISGMEKYVNEENKNVCFDCPYAILKSKF